MLLCTCKCMWPALVQPSANDGMPVCDAWPATRRFGLAVHLKLYPVVYAVPLVCYMSRYHHSAGRRRTVVAKALGLVNCHTVSFAGVSLAVFAVLGVACYARCVPTALLPLRGLPARNCSPYKP